MDAIIKLDALMKCIEQDEKFEQKVDDFIDMVLSHTRYETIIVEIISHDPLFALTILREFSLDAITHSINSSY